MQSILNYGKKLCCPLWEEPERVQTGSEKTMYNAVMYLTELFIKLYMCPGLEVET